MLAGTPSILRAATVEHAIIINSLGEPGDGYAPKAGPEPLIADAARFAAPEAITVRAPAP